MGARRDWLTPALKRAGWWLLDGFTHIAFSFGVWVLCDLPSAWEAWKWNRQQRRAKSHERPS